MSGTQSTPLQNTHYALHTVPVYYKNTHCGMPTVPVHCRTPRNMHYALCQSTAKHSRTPTIQCIAHCVSALKNTHEHLLCMALTEIHSISAAICCRYCSSLHICMNVLHSHQCFGALNQQTKHHQRLLRIGRQCLQKQTKSNNQLRILFFDVWMYQCIMYGTGKLVSAGNQIYLKTDKNTLY